MLDSVDSGVDSAVDSGTDSDGVVGTTGVVGVVGLLSTGSDCTGPDTGADDAAPGIYKTSPG